MFDKMAKAVVMLLSLPLVLAAMVLTGPCFKCNASYGQWRRYIGR